MYKGPLVRAVSTENQDQQDQQDHQDHKDHQDHQDHLEWRVLRDPRATVDFRDQGGHLELRENAAIQLRRAPGCQ
jgi:hypothetical protein